jgi:hypothetical protein
VNAFYTFEAMYLFYEQTSNVGVNIMNNNGNVYYCHDSRFKYNFSAEFLLQTCIFQLIFFQHHFLFSVIKH